MSTEAEQFVLDSNSLELVRERIRVIQLLDAAERAAITPMPAARLHAFAYLADVLSPVWGLPAFDGKVLKIEGGPHYPELQRQVDRLVAMRITIASNIHYIDRPGGGARIAASYALNFSSPHLKALLQALGSDRSRPGLDPHDTFIQSFLVDLATALASVPEDEIEVAATVDATYSDERYDLSNLVDFGTPWVDNPYESNLSQRTADRFETFLPAGAFLSPGEKLFLYATFLGRRINGIRHP